MTKSSRRKLRKITICSLLALLGWGWITVAAASTFTAATAVSASPAQVTRVESDLKENRISEAARQIEALLAADPAAMVETAAGSISVSDWARHQFRSHPALAGAYADFVADRSRAATDALLNRAAPAIGELCRLTERYPLSGDEPRILLVAARRALVLGDPVTAADLAARAGARGDLDEDWRGIAGHDSPGASPLPFAAAWYGVPAAYSAPRFLPVTTGGLSFVAGPGGVTAIAESGEVPWTHLAGAAREQWPLGVRGRGVVFQPAVLTDAAGQPQIVFAQQARVGEATLLLRALAARDGRMLWSSNQREATRDMVMLGPPAVAGRFVYVVTATQSPRGSTIGLVALDAMDGRLLWQRELGVAVDPPVRGRSAPPEYDPQPFWQQSPPTIDGDLVAIAPAGGALLAVDRFTGRLRWQSRYETARPVTADQWSKHRQRLAQGQQSPLPVKSQQLVRYTGAPVVEDGVIVAAPLDTPNVMGFDRESGRLLWTQLHEQAPIVIGAHHGTVVLAGVTVVGLDVRTGGQRWQYAPPAAAVVAGPSVVAGEIVHIPVGNGIVTLSAATGTPARAPALRAIQRFTGRESVRRALADIGVAFSAPERGASEAEARSR